MKQKENYRGPIVIISVKPINYLILNLVLAPLVSRVQWVQYLRVSSKGCMELLAVG